MSDPGASPERERLLREQREERRNDPQQRLTAAFHERTGRCVSITKHLDTKHLDCSQVEQRHREGNHRECLASECDKAALTYDNREPSAIEVGGVRMEYDSQAATDLAEAIRFHGIMTFMASRPNWNREDVRLAVLDASEWGGGGTT